MTTNLDSIKAGILANPAYHKDGAGGLIAAHLVTATIQEVFTFEYPQTKWASGLLAPISFSENPGASSYAYHMVDQVGEAEIVSPMATDIPTAEATGELTTGVIQTVACKIQFSTQDMRAANMAQMMGFPYDGVQLKVSAAMEIHERKIDKLIRQGLASASLYGYTTHPGILSFALPTGAWANPATTAAQIVSDFSALRAYQAVQTNGVESADTAVFPLDVWSRLSGTQNSAASDLTILAYLKLSNPDITLWEVDFGMATAGVGATSVGILYNRNATKARAIMPLRLQPLPVEARGLVLEIVMESRFGGVMAPKPKSICLATGI